MGVGVLVIVKFIIKKNCSARLAVDVRLIASSVVPVAGYIECYASVGVHRVLCPCRGTSSVMPVSRYIECYASVGVHRVLCQCRGTSSVMPV